MINDLLKNYKFRSEIFKSLAHLDSFQISGSLVLISLSLEKAWEKALYSEVIQFLTDLLIFSDISKFPPVLIEMIISNLNKLRFAAEKNEMIRHQWKINKKKIQSSSIEKLELISKAVKCPEVMKFLR